MDGPRSDSGMGIAVAPLLVATFLLPQTLLAQTESGGTSPIEEVVVFGRGIELLGTARAASEGSVAGADLLVRPMLRVAELLVMLAL